MPIIKNCLKIEGDLVDESGSKGLLYRQIISKGNECPLGVVYNDVAPGGNTKDHSHEGFHITYVVKGNGQVRSGDDVHEINQGDLIYLKPFEPHCFFNTGDTIMRLLGIQG